MLTAIAEMVRLMEKGIDPGGRRCSRNEMRGP
jgi:hypothetical protein